MYYYLRMSKKYDNQVPKKKYLNIIGDYNSFPEPYKEVDIQNFWRIFFNSTPDEIEYRQIDIEGITRDVPIYYYFDRAYAIADLFDGINGVYNIKVYECSNIVSVN